MTSKTTGTPRGFGSDNGDVPGLPVWKAFAVQFSRETGKRTGTFAGRIEHLSSGRRARFGSTEELIAALWKMLDELGEK
jgi:hypothetical protein